MTMIIQNRSVRSPSEFLKKTGKACIPCGRDHREVDLHPIGQPNAGNQLTTCTECLTAPDVVLCPAWCTRGQEHDSPANTEHWSDEIELDGAMTVHIEKDEGRTQYVIRAGDCVKIELMDDGVAELVTALVKLMREDLRNYTKKIILEQAS